MFGLIAIMLALLSLSPYPRYRIIDDHGGSMWVTADNPTAAVKLDKMLLTDKSAWIGGKLSLINATPGFTFKQLVVAPITAEGYQSWIADIAGDRLYWARIGTAYVWARVVEKAGRPVAYQAVIQRCSIMSSRNSVER